MNNLMTVNNYGKKYLVEDLQKIEINHVVRQVTASLKKEFISLQLSAIGTGIKLTTSKTGGGGLRIWFVCPQCERRSGTLFQNPERSMIACRKCLNLDYKSHRYNKMAECFL